jgi:hypothetical protein
MAGQYPPSGALFTNERKTADSHPDYNGSLEFSEEVIRDMVDMLKRGETPKCDLAGWKKTSTKTGKTFLSISAKVAFKKDGSSSGGGGGNVTKFKEIPFAAA